MIDIPIVVPMTLDTSQTVFALSLESNQQVVALQSDTVINATIIDTPQYEGEYVVDPNAHHEIVLDTKNKLCTDDITVNKIKTSETTNPYGVTFYIAEA